MPPTGKASAVAASNFYRVVANQLVEEYGQPDLLRLLQQLGAVPA